MSAGMFPITSDDEKKLATYDSDIPLQLLSQFFLKNKAGKFFICRAGLLYKMDKKHKDYSCTVSFPALEEVQLIRMSLGIPNTKAFVVMKATITLSSGAFYTDYGTASFENCDNHNHLVEMASTRASNRAMRMACVMGFTSVEEMEETQTQPIKNITPTRQSNPIQDEIKQTLEPKSIKEFTPPKSPSRNKMMYEVRAKAKILNKDIKELIEPSADGKYDLNNLSDDMLEKLLVYLETKIEESKDENTL